MIAKQLNAVMQRELRTLERELQAYPDEADIWREPQGISNSAGTLTLHLLGNLQHFVGATLGTTGYERNRQAEFERRDVPCAELLEEIDRTQQAVETTLATLAPQRLTAPFPVPFGEITVTTGDFLVHLTAHLAFHLGQIDYHRRLVTGQNESIGPLAIPELHSAGSSPSDP